MITAGSRITNVGQKRDFIDRLNSRWRAVGRTTPYKRALRPLPLRYTRSSSTHTPEPDPATTVDKPVHAAVPTLWTRCELERTTRVGVETRQAGCAGTAVPCTSR